MITVTFKLGLVDLVRLFDELLTMPELAKRPPLAHVLRAVERAIKEAEASI